MLTVVSLAVALLLAILLSGWLVLRLRLVASLDQAMAQHGWVPVNHPLAQPATRSALPERRQVVAQPTTARRHRPAERSSSDQGATKKSREPEKARTEGDQTLSR